MVDFAVLPQRLGPYRLLQHLGTGGLANTFLAEYQGETCEQLRAGQRCALLLVQSLLAQNRRFHAHLLAEAAVMARVEHPHVTQVLRSGWLSVASRPGELAYVALEHVDGLSLAALRRRVAGPFPLPAVVAVAHAGMSALAHAHELKPSVIHADVSPSNLLVDRSGMVKLTDFSAGPSAPHPDWGVNLSYASPEAAVGVALPQSDVFSLAILLWELIHAERYYASLSPGPARPPSPAEIESFRPTLTPSTAAARALDPVLKRALMIDPAQRFESVASFRAAFDNALKSNVLKADALEALGADQPSCAALGSLVRASLA